MKKSVAILLLSSLYMASSLSATPWTHIRSGLANNNPFGADLDAIGGQNNLGQAFDSGIFNNTQGEVTNTYNSWFQAATDAAFNYSSELQLTLGDESTQNSKYAIRIDPETGRRDIIYWSLEQLLTNNSEPAGRNITYDADTDTVTVTSFNGLQEWIQYQTGQPVDIDDSDDNNGTNETNVTIDNETGETEVNVDNDTDEPDVVVNPESGENDVIVNNEDDVTVNNEAGEPDVIVNPENDDTETTNNGSNLNVQRFNSMRDYLHNFIGYEEQDNETYVEDDGLRNAVDNAVAQVGDAAGLENVALTRVNTLDTFVGPDENLWVRLDGNIDSDTDSGNIVAVMLCEGGSDCSDSALQYWWWKSVLLG